jgi:diphosphomevalonate decarboxylase
MLDEQYRREALTVDKLQLPSIPATVGWEAPSNIALVKYWGKKGIQQPLNPSLSMTLSNMHTQTRIHYSRAKKDVGRIWLIFNGIEDHPFKDRIEKYLDMVQPYFPFISHLDLHIDTRNSFPHSAGMASSASAMSSLALSLCSLEQDLREEPGEASDFFQKASFMARLGSGSAARSVYGGYVEWGQHEGGSDEWARPFPGATAEAFSVLNDSVLVVSSQPKKINSSSGHSLMKNHPYREARAAQAGENMERLGRAFKEGDFEGFAATTEEEALSLHAMMLSSRPGYSLLKEATMEIINRIRSYRDSTGTSVAFTLDAGPNLHLLYPTREKEKIRLWMNQQLKPLCEDGKMIHDFTGNGPQRLDR